VRVDRLDGAVWGDVCALLKDPSKVAAEYERRASEGDGQVDSIAREQLAERIKRLKRAVARLIDAYQDGLLDRGEFEPRVRATRDRLAGLEAEWRSLSEREERERGLRLALQGLEEFAGRVESGPEVADWSARREIIRGVVKRVEVGADEVRVVYRVSPPPFVGSPDRGTFQHRGGVQGVPDPGG
jgi:site-specific DNA recombinase